MAAPMKLKSRGTVLSIDGVAVPGLQSIDISGRGNKTYESSTLDGPIMETKDANGYSKAPTIKANGFHDTTFAASIYTLIDAPEVVAAVVTYSNSATDSFDIIGFGLDNKIETDKGVMADYTFEATGVYE